MTVTSSRLVVEAALSAADAKLVREGGSVAIRVPDSGVDATGRSPGSPPPRGPTASIRSGTSWKSHLPASTSGWPCLGGADHHVQSTAGEVLAVPVAALSIGVRRHDQSPGPAPPGSGPVRHRRTGAGGRAWWRSPPFKATSAR